MRGGGDNLLWIQILNVAWENCSIICKIFTHGSMYHCFWLVHSAWWPGYWLITDLVTNIPPWPRYICSISPWCELCCPHKNPEHRLRIFLNFYCSMSHLSFNSTGNLLEDPSRVPDMSLLLEHKRSWAELTLWPSLQSSCSLFRQQSRPNVTKNKQKSAHPSPSLQTCTTGCWMMVLIGWDWSHDLDSGLSLVIAGCWMLVSGSGQVSPSLF